MVNEDEEDVFLQSSGLTVFTGNIFSGGGCIQNRGQTLIPAHTILIIIALMNRGRCSENTFIKKKTKVEKYILCLRLCS